MPHDRDEWLSRIKSAERELASVQLATSRLLADAEQDPGILRKNLRIRDVRLAVEHVDATYIVRLFAEFESGLRSWWLVERATEPRTEDLINGVAARRRIADDLTTDVHSVRDYRNSLVHERDEFSKPIVPDEVRRRLCRFFAFLPLRW